MRIFTAQLIFTGPFFWLNGNAKKTKKQIVAVPATVNKREY